MSSLRQRLKNRLLSLPEDIATGVKQLSSASVPVSFGLPAEPSSPAYRGSASRRRAKARLEAGAELLQIYQDEWASLHAAGEKNARAAAECDAAIARLRAAVERDWTHVASLQMLTAQLSSVTERVRESAALLAGLEADFSRVEVALLALEDTADAGEAQRRQDEERRKVDGHERRRRERFDKLSDRLNTDYLKKKEEHEKRESLKRQEKSSQYQQKFQQDMAAYSSRPGFLQVPSRHDPDASLETVDLDADEDELDNFLGGDVPDASPLPKDDADPAAAATPSPASAEGILDLSAAESTYFTPSDTLENIAGAVQNVRLDND